MTIKDIVSIALFAALIAALGFIPPLPVPFLPVPITAQLLGVMLSGAMLGATRGTLAIIVVWILVLAGLPILSGGRGGISAFMAPTTGYLIGWGFGAFVIGMLYQFFSNKLTPFYEIVILAIGGIVVVHGLGIIWLGFVTNMGFLHAFLADLIFIPGDAVKVAIAYFIIKSVRKALPNFMERV